MRNATVATSLLGLLLGCRAPQGTERLDAIHEAFVFADIHAHPSRFHRANIASIAPEEIQGYAGNLIDVVVANISTDAAYDGGYQRPDDSIVRRLPRGEFYDITPEDAWAFTLARFEIIMNTIENGYAVHGTGPDVVAAARQEGKVTIIPALEGADGLGGNIENLRTLHERGLRLVQLVHFRDNELGFNQTAPYDPGGLTAFGREVVAEANRLGIVVDLAHANTETIMDALQVSTKPILFSHTGVKARIEADRHLTDDEIRAIAAGGGMVGIWPTASFETLDEWVQHVDHVKQLVGIDHVGIASDLRGMSYLDAFGEEANFRALGQALLDYGYTEEEVGKVMGGNFFRIWEDVAGG